MKATDIWFDVIVKRQGEGECYLIRYYDDFICCFQNRYGAGVLQFCLGVWGVIPISTGESILEMACDSIYWSLGNE